MFCLEAILALALILTCLGGPLTLLSVVFLVCTEVNSFFLSRGLDFELDLEEFEESLLELDRFYFFYFLPGLSGLLF